jgi:hypothetical protein
MVLLLVQATVLVQDMQVQVQATPRATAPVELYIRLHPNAPLAVSRVHVLVQLSRRQS